MKLPLDTAPWTQEDKAVIAFRLAHTARHGYNFFDHLGFYANADRLDAFLMSWIQQVRHRPDGTGYRGALNTAVSIADQNPIDVGGVLP